MYLAVVAALMVVLPIASVLAEWALATSPGDLLLLAGKWFVFWSVGVRLLIAGIKQMTDPAFTARVIFEIESADAEKIVSELGIANVSMGVVGVLSLYFPAWALPVAVCAMLFYGLAGFRHIRNESKNFKETVATWTDIWIAIVLAIFVFGSLLRVL